MFATARIVFVAVIVTTLVMFPTVSHSQSGGATLQGTVTDPAGAVVPDAKIQIVDELTGVSRDVISNSGGIYSPPNLSPGRYKVTISAPGFAPKIETDLSLTLSPLRYP